MMKREKSAMRGLEITVMKYFGVGDPLNPKNLWKGV